MLVVVLSIVHILRLCRSLQILQETPSLCQSPLLALCTCICVWVMCLSASLPVCSLMCVAVCADCVGLQEFHGACQFSRLIFRGGLSVFVRVCLSCLIRWLCLIETIGGRMRCQSLVCCLGLSNCVSLLCVFASFCLVASHTHIHTQCTTARTTTTQTKRWCCHRHNTAIV